MKKRWKLKESGLCDVAALASQLHISPVLAQVLVNRGITDVDEGRAFLTTSQGRHYDPFIMKGLPKAVDRICEAIDTKESIAVYGDYDVDGITATSLVLSVLHDLGALAAYHIPERQSEGYGLNEGALQELCDAGTDLVITVDCGISSADLVKEFQGRLDLIITDHHEPPAELPQAYSVINPKQPGCPYPCKDLAGAGVAYKLCQALWKRRCGEDLPGYTELAALGTIADLVPLRDENRTIVQSGLKRMKEGYNTGLQALLRASSLAGDTITAGRIAFTAAPRLNASGRISSGSKGVELLLETDKAAADGLARELSELNSQRQAIERDIADEAVSQVETKGYSQDGVLVVSGPDWHPGVIGIAASRLVEAFYRPSLVISLHDGIGKGSCRSIDGFNMYEALTSAKDLLIQYGGHPMAAGFSIEEGNIDAFRDRLNGYAAAHMTAEDYVPSIAIDKELTPQDVTLELIDELSRLEPYGMGNSRPVFTLCQADIDEIYPIGRDKQHLRLTVEAGRHRLSCVGWSMADFCDEMSEGDTIDLAFQLERNEFRGVVTPQLVIQDLHSPDWPIHLDRAIMIDVYLALKKIIPDGGMIPLNVRRGLLAAEGDRYDRHTLLAALRVLREITVIGSRKDPDGVYYYFPHVAGKMNLSSSPTYQQYGMV